MAASSALTRAGFSMKSGRDIQSRDRHDRPEILEMKADTFLAKRGERERQRQLTAVAMIVVLMGIPGGWFIAARAEQPGSTTSVGTTQRAILYEENPNDARGSQYEGTVKWRAGPVAATARQPRDLAILADIEVPERNVIMTLSIRRNADVSLPASHVTEVAFILPADFSGGAIDTVKGILMKSSEHAKAVALVSITARIRDNLFLIGMSNGETERLRNIRLLKEESWMDIAIVYRNQRRAIIVLEKGRAGKQAFDQAFTAWKQ